jgi:dihydroneopterin aldolase
VTGRIDLTGIEVWARHGVFESEKRDEQLFRVDVSATLDLAAASGSDDLADTLDYGGLAQRVHDLVAAESHNLIETIADRLATLVLEDARIDSVSVTVHKPQAPIPVAFEDVAVTVVRHR